MCVGETREKGKRKEANISKHDNSRVTSRQKMMKRSTAAEIDTTKSSTTKTLRLPLNRTVLSLYIHSFSTLPLPQLQTCSSKEDAKKQQRSDGRKQHDNPKTVMEPTELW